MFSYISNYDNDYEPSISEFERDKQKKGIYYLNVDGAIVWYKNDRLYKNRPYSGVVRSGSSCR